MRPVTPFATDHRPRVLLMHRLRRASGIAGPEWIYRISLPVRPGCQTAPSSATRPGYRAVHPPERDPPWPRCGTPVELLLTLDTPALYAYKRTARVAPRVYGGSYIAEGSAGTNGDRLLPVVCAVRVG